MPSILGSPKVAVEGFPSRPNNFTSGSKDQDGDGEIYELLASKRPVYKPAGEVNEASSISFIQSVILTHLS